MPKSHTPYHTWADNPWVTVTRFEAILGNVDSLEVRRCAGKQREARDAG